MLFVVLFVVCVVCVLCVLCVLCVYGCGGCMCGFVCDINFFFFYLRIQEI